MQLRLVQKAHHQLRKLLEMGLGIALGVRDKAKLHNPNRLTLRVEARDLPLKASYTVGLH